MTLGSGLIGSQERIRPINLTVLLYFSKRTRYISLVRGKLIPSSPAPGSCQAFDCHVPKRVGNLNLAWVGRDLKLNCRVFPAE